MLTVTIWVAVRAMRFELSKLQQGGPEHAVSSTSAEIHRNMSRKQLAAAVRSGRQQRRGQ